MNLVRVQSEQSAPALPYGTPMVYVLDKDVSAREGLDALIKSAGWQPRTFASEQEFLACPRTLAPRCLIRDISRPCLNGRDLWDSMTDRAGMPTIFITADDDVEMAVRAMKAGAVDVFTKPFLEDSMRHAIAAALESSRIAVAKEAAVQPIRERYASLTCREREVMRLLVAGLVNWRVGLELGIRECTVKAHRSEIMRKMNARSLAHLINLSGVVCACGAGEISTTRWVRRPQGGFLGDPDRHISGGPWQRSSLPA
jgi:FixJ family two-component response regulator